MVLLPLPVLDRFEPSQILLSRSVYWTNGIKTKQGAEKEGE